MRDVGSIFQHIEIFDGVHVFSIAVRKSYFSGNNINSMRKKLYEDLGKNISILDLFYGKHTSLTSNKFHLRRIDLEILECLLSDPRMTFLNIARTIGCSQRTIIRRIEKLKSSRVIMGFSLHVFLCNLKGMEDSTLLIEWFDVFICSDAINWL
jgi:hypothetical protein